MGLLTKFNLLTIGLIFLTAIATTGFYLWQQWRDEDTDLRARGATVARDAGRDVGVRSRRAATAAYLEAVLDSLSADGDVAYVAHRSTRSASRSPRGGSPSRSATRRCRRCRRRGAAGARSDRRHASVDDRGQRYVELIGAGRRPKASSVAPVTRRPSGSAADAAAAAAAAATGPIGYVRLGMTFERQQQQFRKHLIGALSVVALLIVLTIGATFLLTRGLVAPMRRLMRAARAVGSGKLDVYVPRDARPTSSACSRTRSTT